MTVERLSLAQQIAQLEDAAPIDYDPEDLQSRGVEGGAEMVVDGSVTREHYLEVGPSDLRNRLPSVADAKYEGVRTSRKQLLEDTDDSAGSGSDESDEESAYNDLGGEGTDDKEILSTDGRIFTTRLPDDESPSESAEESSGEHSGSHHQILPASTPREEPTEDITPGLKRMHDDDVKKGQAVKRQIAIWDSLLDTRIRLQKSVVSANRLPQPSQITKYLENSECRNSLSTFLTEASLLTDELMELQENLLITNDAIELPRRKRRKLDAEPSLEDFHQLFVDATKDVMALEQNLHPYLTQTLSKWSSKIQAVAPSVLLPSTRGTFLKGNQSLKSVVQIIDETLSDHDKLLARTQVTRVKRARIGASEEENAGEGVTLDPEVFDDTDFYQRMLRDIIDARGNGSKTEDWMLLQKQKKAKKKVDTKASKGRKLRYEVHEKLRNFMVPVPVPGAWHDEQVDELFASLLGKGFENIGIADPEPVASVSLTGFRVFG